MKTIFKNTAISAFALIMSAACSKKDAASSEIQAAGSAGACPSVANLEVGQGASYALDNPAAQPPKTITVYKVQDSAKKDRSYYAMSFNGQEYVVYSDNKNEQGQPVLALDASNVPVPPSEKQKTPGALRASCVSNAFVVAGTDEEGKDASLHITSDVNHQGEPILKTDFGTYTRTNAAVGAYDSFINSVKDLGKQIAAKMGSGDDSKQNFVSGLPRKGDTK